MFTRLWRLGIIDSEEKNRLSNLCRYACVSDGYIENIRKELEIIQQKTQGNALKQEVDNCIIAIG